jgi:arylsulfatase A-like enzyme
MFTGLFCHNHKVSFNPIDHCLALPESAVTIAEMLRYNGYATALYTAQPALCEHDGFLQGFTEQAHVPEREIVGRSLEFLDRHGDTPVFVVAYWINPHAPYSPTPQHDLWSKPSCGPINISPSGTEGEGFVKKNDVNNGKVNLTPEQWSQLEAQYDGEIHRNDADLGKLWDGLVDRGLTNRTMIILCSDHGEGFNEHPRQRVWHDLPYETILRVPLIVYYPKKFPPGKVTTAVSLVDLYPTIVRAAGGSVRHSINGLDLCDALRRGAENRCIAGATYFWGGTIFYRGDGLKFFYSRKGAERPELYDLENDPEEQNNLADSNPVLVAEFKQRLDRFLAATSIHIDGAGKRPATLADIERLRALGYVE